MARNDPATSHTLGIALMVVVTLVIAALVLVMVMQYSLPGPDPTPPDIFRISRIVFTPSADGTNTIAVVVVTNTGDRSYPTLNNDLFIHSVHTGIARLRGVGTWGNPKHATAIWAANNEISIEYEKRKIRPGDQVTLEFIDTVSGQILSRDTWPHSDTRDAQWFYNYFLNHQGA
jgi:hypothetical protein